jgi:hypothetical protein
MPGSWLPTEFPNLQESDYEKTSDFTITYNCFAWAAEEINHRWDPNTYYWPKGVPREVTMEAFIQAFQTRGYEVCENPDLQEGYQKIAIYADRLGDPTHAARQLENGVWTSKLGDYEDIKHGSLECLRDYGTVAKYMRRPRTNPDCPTP